MPRTSALSYLRFQHTAPHTHTDVHISANTVTLIWFVLLFQSKYKEEGKKEASMSLYSVLPETPETQHAREASELRSEVLMSVSVRNSTENRHFQTFSVAPA